MLVTAGKICLCVKAVNFVFTVREIQNIWLRCTGDCILDWETPQYVLERRGMQSAGEEE
jgi:hypothetical protein